MSRIFAFLMVVILTSPAFAIEGIIPNSVNVQDPRYRVCETSSDCTLFRYQCSPPISVNKTSLPLLNSMQSTQPVSCAVNKATSDVPTCVRGYCVFEAMTNARALEERDERYCETAADCQAVVNACGQPAAFNKNFAQKKIADYAAANPAANCRWREDHPVVGAECRLNRCAAVVDKSISQSNTAPQNVDQNLDQVIDPTLGAPQ